MIQPLLAHWCNVKKEEEEEEKRRRKERFAVLEKITLDPKSLRICL